VGADDAVAKLQSCRGRIDQLDARILELLNERAGIALEIGAAKREAGLPVVELSREKAVIAGAVSRSGGPLSPAAIENIYTAIMLEMRRLQE
jgi:chorismate mutase